MKLRRPQINRYTLLGGVLLLYLMMVAALKLAPLPSGIEGFPSSPSFYDQRGNLFYASLSANDEWSLDLPLEDNGAWIGKVAVAIEDKRFYWHSGIDYLAVMRAARLNITGGRVRSGASTITSQVIRLSTPRPRTYAVKLAEFWAARRLEAKLSKKQILELYLNRAPFGGNLRGVEAAARAYFGKPAKTLSLGESALLVSILRTPSRLRPDRYPLRAKKARDAVLARLLAQNVITEQEYRGALREPIAATRAPFPQKMLHAAKHAQKEVASGRIITTIEQAKQEALEHNLELALRQLPKRVTAAGIVVRNSDRSVLAYVGNARYGSSYAASLVDCGNAPRSPGSTLKPFVYALYFGEGDANPATMIADTPVAFRGSAPRNSDLSYRGPVSARSALALSLNAPAVRVLRSVGYERAITLYRDLDFSFIDRDAKHYTDSLVLGGCEVTLLQLARAYVALANDGVCAPIRFTENRVQGATEQVAAFTPEAAFITLDILRDERRRMPLYQRIAGNAPPIAFKTGTSYGSRDAWTAAVSTNLTVIVWFGDASGAGYRQLVGLDLASPVALRILTEADSKPASIPKPPKRVYKRRVCSLSGSVPGELCSHTYEEFAIRDRSSTRICNMHIIGDEGEPIIKWPDELRAWVQMSPRLRTTTQEYHSVRITRPVKGATLFLPEGKEKLRLYLDAEGDGERFWFLDGIHVATARDGGSFIDVGPGQHRLSVQIGGRSDRVTFHVERRAKEKPPLTLLGH